MDDGISLGLGDWDDNALYYSVDSFRAKNHLNETIEDAEEEVRSRSLDATFFNDSIDAAINDVLNGTLEFEKEYREPDFSTTVMNLSFGQYIKEGTEENNCHHDNLISLTEPVLPDPFQYRRSNEQGPPAYSTSWRIQNPQPFASCLNNVDLSTLPQHVRASRPKIEAPSPIQAPKKALQFEAKVNVGPPIHSRITVNGNAPPSMFVDLTKRNEALLPGPAITFDPRPIYEKVNQTIWNSVKPPTVRDVSTYIIVGSSRSPSRNFVNL